jgi:SARP family transcriptional regulator, regulator of embCAB operon
VEDEPQVRVHLLGNLEVERADGSIVDPHLWRTSKTMDLLRLLALSNGQVVRTDGLLDKLWPTVSTTRGRASLRTASSQVRRAIGAPCVVRLPDGLALEGAWVDVQAFTHGARRVQQAVLEARHTDVVELAAGTDELYRGEFHAHDDDSDWARSEREHLFRVRQEMLTEAALAALELRRFREALDFASTAVELDWTAETPHRALMRAHAGLGEIGSALRVFETYRAHLAEELGADPSRQTLDLHLRLLRSSRG